MAENENPGAEGTAHGVLDDVRDSNSPELASDIGHVNGSNAQSYVASTINIASPVYVASTIKRERRTKKEIRTIKDAIIDILSIDNPQTVRQVFYALTVRGAIRKEEVEYQRTVVRLLTEMREREEIPFEWIANNTRWMRKPTSFTGLDACLDATSSFYRRDLWAAMPVYVEVWCEKDALAGVLLTETEVYDVPLMTARGYSSLSFL